MSKARTARATAKFSNTESVTDIAQEASDTMSNTTAEINSFVETARKYAAPIAKANELSARAFERFARYQYEVAGDFLNFGIAQLHAATSSKDMPALLQKQAELANTYFEKQTQRSQDLLRIAGEAQSELTQFIDGATAELTARAKAA